MFTVAEDSCFADAAFFPGLVAGACVEECFAVEEEFGAEGAEYFLGGLAGGEREEESGGLGVSSVL